MATLTHGMQLLGEHPRDIATNAGKQARLAEKAEEMGLRAEFEYEDWGVYLWVHGPSASLETLAEYADKELDRYVDVEEEEG